MNIPRTLLYAADVSFLADKALYDAAYSAVSDERRCKTDRFRVPEAQYLSLGAELLLRYGLHAAGVPESAMRYEYAPDGKPYLPDNAVQFSLSHSGIWVLCAVSESPVGCDVETVAPVDIKLARRFFTPAEYEDIAAQMTSEAQTERFYRYWTLKESFMKVTGLGLKLPLNAFRIIFGSEITVEQNVDTRRYAFREFTVPGCRCAVCTVESCADAELSIIDLTQTL